MNISESFSFNNKYITFEHSILHTMNTRHVSCNIIKHQCGKSDSIIDNIFSTLLFVEHSF